MPFPRQVRSRIGLGRLTDLERAGAQGRPGAVHQIRAYADHGGDDQGRDDRLAEPDDEVPRDHREDHLVRRHRSGAPDREQQREHERGDRHADKAATAAAGATTPSRSGSTARIALKTSQPTATPTRAISVMLVPSAVMPPSAMNSACTISTVLTHSTAVQGPTSTAASVPRAGVRWCRPRPGSSSSGRRRRRSRRGRPSGRYGRRVPCALRAAPARCPPTATTPVAMEVGASRNPSGTCMSATLRYCKLFATTSNPDWSPSRDRHPADHRPPLPRRHRAGLHAAHRHRRRGLAVRPARPQGDRLLLPGRDDGRLHQAGLRLHRLARVAAGCRLRGRRHLARQAGQAGEVPRARRAVDHPRLGRGQVRDERPTARSARRSSTARSSRA